MFDRLFRPRGVAVVGASRNPAKIGSRILSNILTSGYAGAVHPINPGGGAIMGRAVSAAVADAVAASGPVDLACIAVPAPLVEAAVRDCVRAGVEHLAIITSGFSEVGQLELENRVVGIAKDGGARVLGPNIFGVYSAAAPMNATFGPSEIRAGHIAIITQSGALGIAMMGRTAAEKIGLSAVVSVGNKSDVDEADLLEYLADDPETRVILMYIEGVKHGWKLVERLPAVTARKPVIVLKSGRSKRGAMAAASHTGSLAGADAVFSAVMEQCGALRAGSIEEAFDWAKFLSSGTLPAGDNAVILTNGGGVGVLATDACEADDVPLFDDQDRLRAIFTDCVPDFGTTQNPVDMTGGALLADYHRVIGHALDEPDVHAAIVLGCETAVLDGAALDETIRDVLAARPEHKPVVFSFVGGKEMSDALLRLRLDGYPVFPEVVDAVSCMGAVYAYRRAKVRVAERADALDPYRAAIDRPKIAEVLRRVREANRRFLLAPEARDVMDALGVALPKNAVARTLEQAVFRAESIGYPLVMKVVSQDIIHKSDAGGVVLDIDNRDEAVDAYEVIMHRCKAHNPKARIEGVEIAEQVAKGVEIIVGGRRDPSFGPTVMFGLGGIYVEVLKDVSFRALPLSTGEARRMIRDIRTYPLLLGVRGEPAKDMDAILDTILRVGALLDSFDDIADVEINPLMVYEQGRGGRAVDVRILLGAPDKGAGK